MKTLYKTRWYLGSIDGGRDTTNPEIVLQDVAFAIAQGFTHIEIRTEELSLDSPDIP